MPKIKRTETDSSRGQARQKRLKKRTKSSIKSSDEAIEPAILVEGLTEESPQMANDTNMLVYTKKEAKDDTRIQTQPKRLSRKERIRLEKIVEKKEKTNKRAELLEKLAAFQVNTRELNMYSSVKSIGQKEKKKNIDDPESGDENSRPITVNAIAGGNRKKRKYISEEPSVVADDSVDTDEISSDSEVDEDYIQKAVENYKKNAENLRVASLNLARQEKAENKKPKVDFDSEEDEKPEVVSSGVRKTKYVHVERREEIKESRAKLPIITEEQVIMEKIWDNDIVIICGETGSGKTTQVPQFLYEAGYASEEGQMIGITEPRRVAAISMANRVNDEMNFKADEGVCSFHIRYEGNYSPNTRLKFMTDGVLLKEVQTDFLLNKYSAIIIDEAHERSVYTDILIGLLSRIVPLRKKRNNPLKLIIMSATLRVEDFTENRRLFKQIPPVIKVDARQFPVSVHFNKRTVDDYLAEAFKKVCRIHERLPEGGILVFVTGQQEVNVLCNKLRKAYPNSSREMSEHGKDVMEEENLDARRRRNKRRVKDNDVKELNIKDTPKVSLDKYSTVPLDEELENLEEESDEEMDMAFDLSVDSDDDEEFADEIRGKIAGTKKALHVLPLYSLMSSDKQQRIFDKVPDGCRLVVVATNVAETSLTIPNTKYVVDTGKIKMKFYDKVTGVSTFRICWTSQASAEQRSGRAGRTGPGHCYRLYSSAVFNDEFTKFSEPEIARKPVEDLILQMKDLGIDRISNFPFPTPPDETAVKTSENLLIQLGALEHDNSRSKNSTRHDQVTKITELGKMMASFPINPRYGKMLTLASQQSDTAILSYVICMISGLSVPELFIDGETIIEQKQPAESSKPLPANLSFKEQQRAEAEAAKQKRTNGPALKIKYSQMRQSWLNGVSGSSTMLLGDLMLLLVALGAVEYEQYNTAESPQLSHLSNEQKCIKFCEQYGIRYKAIVEARKLRKQLVNTVNIILPSLELSIDPLMSPPNQEQARLIRQIVLSGMVDKIARRYDHVIHDKEGKELKNAYQGLLLVDPIFIHPSSVLFKQLPEFVCYVEMVETSKLYMKGICGIDAEWLAIYLGNQCAFEKPVVNETDKDYEVKKPRFDSEKGIVVCHRESTFGRVMWKVAAVEVEFPESLDLFKWFARFLLEGKVCEELKKYDSVMLASPSTMLKSWAKLQPRTEMLLNALIKENCMSRKRLLQVWSTQKDYLINEYLMWLPESLHFEVRLKWPPINQA